MQWLEFASDEPESGVADLRPLLDMVGDARVIGLGECTDGSREVHRLKHRFLEFLAEELNVTTIVLEANLAEVIRVNEYSLEGRGRPPDLLRRHLYREVCTEEVADLLRWMWTFNSTGERGRIALAGCDTQRIDSAAEIVEDYLGGVDLYLAASVAERYDQILEAERVRWLSGMGVQAWFPVEEARGRQIRFSAYVRTEDVGDHACIWGWAGGSEGTLAHDSLEGRRPRGTTGWRGYAVELDVPEAAQHVSFGCFLAGNGKAWFDGLAIEVDGVAWRHPELIDLNLSTPELHGFWVDPRNRAALDPDVSRTGRASLRIEPAELVPAFDMGDVEALSLAKQVLAELEESLPPQGSAKPLRCARAIVQSLEMRTGGGDAARARSMAKNIEWLLERSTDDRIVFWAHNGHIARGGSDTGAFLARSLGDAYLPIGFATGGGTCLTMSPRWREGLRTHPLAPPPLESFEQRLIETGHPRSVLDLRTVAPGDSEWGWLLDRRLFRNVGASALPNEFGEQRIRDDFDLLVWIEETSAAKALPLQ